MLSSYSQLHIADIFNDIFLYIQLFICSIYNRIYGYIRIVSVFTIVYYINLRKFYKMDLIIRYSFFIVKSTNYQFYLGLI